MRIPFPLLMLLAVPSAVRPQTSPDEFARVVRPILARNCSGCHKAGNGRGPVDFLSAQTARDVESKRGVWRNVAAQLRNRTMPPAASNLTEQERLQVSTWIDQDLKRTACSGQEYAGWVTSRRLNRREYRNTVRDLLGVDLDVSEFFPEDGSGGEGFDTNGETLYLAPLLMERYLQAAHQILDRTIVTPALTKTIGGADFQGQASGVDGTRRTIAAGEEITGHFSVYADGMYGINFLVERSMQSQLGVTLKVDGAEAGALTFSRYESKGTTGGGKTVKLARGPHSISILAPKLPIQIITVTIAEKQQDPTPEKKALHYRLFGMEAGQTPLDSRKAAERLLTGVVRKAYRRPLQRGEIDSYLKLYDRAAERGDPYEERIKLAMTAVLVSPKFLFRVEDSGGKPGIHALTSHEVASRLSYFLWSTMPDEELSRLADEGKLQDPKVLSSQVDRMLNDPRSRVFAETFIGQWLGTKDVGFRVVPALNELHDFYTPEVAADLRQEPVLFFHYLLSENAPLLDMLDARYSFLSERLVKFYQLQGQVKITGEDFQRVQWPDDRRGGVLGLGSVLAMTSHSKQTSPVLRGAWVLETLLGTKAPPPPPNIPPLDAAAHKGEKLTVREKLLRHRADASCATCHNLIDPIGFALENFDWMGRWRESENGRPVDASAVMPSGEKLNGPVELRKILLSRKSEFLQNLTSKVLGYALGRSLQDGDQCNVQKITQALERDHYGARTLLREVVLSVPFRNGQSGVEIAPAPAVVRRPRREVEK